jgi:hypothetical protein
MPRQNKKCRLDGIIVALDVADEYDVVAAVMPVFIAAFEMGSGVDQYGAAAF